MLSLGPRSLGILSVKADFSEAAFGGRRHINVSLLPILRGTAARASLVGLCSLSITVTSPDMIKPLSASRGASINGHLTAF